VSSRKSAGMPLRGKTVTASPASTVVTSPATLSLE
jgi:hypothetical protein